MDNKTFDACTDKYNGVTDLTWDELAEQLDYDGSGENLRLEHKRERERRGIPAKSTMPSHEDITSEDPSDYISNFERSIGENSGESTIEMTIDFDRKNFLEEIFHTKNKTAVDMLLFHGFDPDAWDSERMHVKSNGWMMPAGGGEYYYCYQSKISVQPKKQTVNPEFIKQYFDDLLRELADNLPEFPQAPLESYSEDGVTVEVDMADFHLGKLTFGKNGDITGDLINAMHDIYNQIAGKKIKEILLVSLGDITQYDSSGKKQTTRGTDVDSTDETPQELFDMALNVSIYIAMLFMRLAPVRVISVFGNHDENVSYYLFKALALYFRNSEDISFDVDHNAHKAVLIGKTLVGFSHGNANKARLKTNLLQVLYRELWGQATWSEIHVGHYHSEEHKEDGGLTVRYIPSISPSDKWHHDNLFIGAKRAVTAFVYHDERGLRNIIYSLVE